MEARGGKSDRRADRPHNGDCRSAACTAAAEGLQPRNLAPKTHRGRATGQSLSFFSSPSPEERLTAPAPLFPRTPPPFLLPSIPDAGVHRRRGLLRPPRDDHRLAADAPRTHPRRRAQLSLTCTPPFTILAFAPMYPQFHNSKSSISPQSFRILRRLRAQPRRAPPRLFRAVRLAPPIGVCRREHAGFLRQARKRVRAGREKPGNSDSHCCVLAFSLPSDSHAFHMLLLL